AQQAEAESTLVDTAIDKLATFKKEHPESWQISSACRSLAALYMAKRDWENAQKTYQDLAKTPNVSEEIVLECNLALAQVLVRAQKYPEAVAKLTELEKTTPADTPQAIRLQITKAQCLAASNKMAEAATQLEGIIAKSTDKDIIANAYNTLGDCYRNANPPQLRAAMWEYLYVDLIYSQNRQEHAKAVYHLARLFHDLNDDKRAKI